MSTAAGKTKFSIVCCEETEVTKQISRAVSEWQLPGVRSLLVSEDYPTDQLLAADENGVAQSDYAIFITPHERPSSQVKIGPLSAAQVAQKADAEQSPAAILAGIHSRHGQSPQSWWLQLPTTELRARRVHPVASEKSVAQALSQIEVFVRNYRLAVAPRDNNQAASESINNDLKPVALTH